MRMERNIRQRLSRGIERFLKKSGLKYMVDEDGDFQLVVAFEEIPLQARVLIMREGLLGEILSVVVRYEGEIASSVTKEEALEKANAWNCERRWPRVYWRDGHFYGDFHLDVEEGISQKLLELTLHRLLMGILHFLLHLSGKEQDMTKRLYREWLGLARLN
jgi:hypothetical protein